jgi:hypothetical protein
MQTTFDGIFFECDDNTGSDGIISRKFNVHKPYEIVDDVTTEGNPPQNGLPGKIGAKKHVTLQVVDTNGTPMPGVIVQERWPDNGYPYNANLKKGSFSEFDNLGYIWPTPVTGNEVSIQNNQLYVAGTIATSLTAKGIPLHTYLLIFDPSPAQAGVRGIVIHNP